MKPYIIPEVFDGYVHSGYALLEIGIQAVIFGFFFGLINFLVDSSRLRKRSFGFLILVKSILYFIAVSLSQFVVFLVYHIFNIFPKEYMMEMTMTITPTLIISMGLYFILVILLINFVLQVNRKFGYGILYYMLIGKYHKPRKERRIFMFLDMKDSTGNAEELGHVWYSKLIQSCVHELTDLITRYKAEVYQYVGDEVVLTWKTQKGLRNLNCLKLFYAFQQRLEDKEDHYQKSFRTRPRFKAGMSEGVVTAAEVGDIKRELAYHGETLHTAARLEKLCNQLGQDLLITERLLVNLPRNNEFATKLIGEYQLRGKGRKEKVYGVNRF